MVKHSDNPVMRQAQALIKMANEVAEYTAKYLDLEEVQRQQAIQMEELEAKTVAVLDKTGYFSILAYANIAGVRLCRQDAQKLGKMATKISNEMNCPIGKVPDERWGHVGTYHKSVLELVFRAAFSNN